MAGHPRGMEGRLDIDRRRLLAGTACLALAVLPGPRGGENPAGTDEIPSAPPWHPLTRSLLDRARRANSVNGRSNTASIERIVREVAGARSCTERPVIEWLDDPSCAFDHLSRYGLDELLRMGTASLWSRAGLRSFPVIERSFSTTVLGGIVAEIVGAAEHDRALMAPKLLSKSRAMAEGASAEAAFRVRAVAAQIGWLETCMPVTAAEGVSDVEALVSAGFPEHGEPVSHQLRVFEAYELGLLATWETPDVIICVPRTLAV